MNLLSLVRALTLSISASMILISASHAGNALHMTLQANKVVTKSDGSVSYIPVSSASAGTVIQYRATFKNTIDSALNDVVITLPIPEKMSFTGEAFPASAQATLDGRNYADMPLVRRENGKIVNVPYSEYKGLKWNIKYLPAKKTATVALNALVN